MESLQFPVCEAGHLAKERGASDHTLSSALASCPCDEAAKPKSQVMTRFVIYWILLIGSVNFVHLQAGQVGFDRYIERTVEKSFIMTIKTAG